MSISRLGQRHYELSPVKPDPRAPRALPELCRLQLRVAAGAHIPQQRDSAETQRLCSSPGAELRLCLGHPHPSPDPCPPCRGPGHCWDPERSSANPHTVLGHGHASPAGLEGGPTLPGWGCSCHCSAPARARTPPRGTDTSHGTGLSKLAVHAARLGQEQLPGMWGRSRDGAEGAEGRTSCRQAQLQQRLHYHRTRFL